jgi:hypothetical protein
MKKLEKEFFPLRAKGTNHPYRKDISARLMPPGDKIKLIYFWWLRYLWMAKKCQKMIKRHIFDYIGG